MEDGAKEAESCGGAMPAMEYHGKLHAMRQRMHGGLWNVTTVGFSPVQMGFGLGPNFPNTNPAQ